MNTNISNIDDKFRDAFDNWEADFSLSEMETDWSQLSSKLEAPPVQPAAQTLSKSLWSTGKVLGFISSAAIISTAAVILYQTHIYEGEKIPPVTQNEKKITEDAPVLLAYADTNKIISIKTSEDVAALTQNETAKHNPILNLTRNNNKQNITSENSVINDLISSYQASVADFNPYIEPEKNASSGDETSIKNTPTRTANTLSKRDIVFSDTILCLGKSLSVSYIGTQLPEGTVLEWGDGNMQPFAKSNFHVYTRSGKYLIRIKDGNRTVEKVITVSDFPEASFTSFQCDKMRCKFRNNSNNGYKYVWNFGDGTAEVNDFHPEHQFYNTGEYTVKLKAYNTSGCVDSFIRLVRVTAHEKPFIPNQLTPNGDGDNDRFLVGISNEAYYQLRIMDAGGRIVFESNDKNHTWDGTWHNQGSACAEGKYVYILTYKFNLLDPLREEKGILQLMR